MTTSTQTPRKAVALISGGLDSMLATQVMLDQGIHVEGINFFTGFCVEGHTHAIRQRGKSKPVRNNALWVAEQLGIKLHIVDVVEEYKDVLLNPKHGYGKNLNPCMDCKIFMVHKALEWIQAKGFDFIITGEVIGQRPKSQLKRKMPVIAKQSGAQDLLLRPLCAQLLDPTLPEREGWVDREKLYAFSGRSRGPQMALAEHYGFKDYAQPAGGCCFLTDKSYAIKLTDLWNTRQSRDYTLDDIMLLKVGRHLRPRPHFKMIVGREEGENNFLMGYRKQFIHMHLIDHEGPLVLLDGENISDEDLKLAAQITARYSKGREASEVSVGVFAVNAEERRFNVAPLTPDDIEQGWHI